MGRRSFLKNTVGGSINWYNFLKFRVTIHVKNVHKVPFDLTIPLLKLIPYINLHKLYEGIF